ncbi:hypothetical protein BJ875DRAFT_487126 [Amylocarpus encephaloides]|uniref:SAM-dependent MTase RsmB/NOP-type domain-containing protein n=1 Tax=Amylocarpus encephaloides TaxID=45428 RepID=A0A9P7YE28_9HELO|nr:hypothetical protein BJ875DRAFT_487126 [Amylocarpus encephaloides]
MGRGGKKNRGGRGGGRGRGRGGGGRRGEDDRVSFENVPKSHPRLEGYYNSILGLTEEEQLEFWTAYKRELPNSFRFTGHALAVQKKLKERYVPEISKINHWNGVQVEPPIPVTWYPDELAWWMTTPKNVVRKFAPFSAFQKFLVSETSVGNISRQEVVSMIPPLVIDLQPGMTVLDMCAAPGSKAAQLLEMVHNGEEARVHKALRDFAEVDGRPVSPGSEYTLEGAEALDTSDNGRATGLLIANDSDYKRSHMLIHQLKRLSSPNLIVTNHDATMYPSIKLPPTPENPSPNRYLKFDRILADVPCSGDGTLRKNVDLWRNWSPGNAIGLHLTQARILVRALQMLKVGGRVVYSTCSMNPVENESVIASAIERCGGIGKVRVVETDDKLPLLKRYSGLGNWRVMDKSGQFWNSYEEVDMHHKEHGTTYASEKILPGMFPPSAEAKIPLERCIRVYAHQQDTGGFFIAILEKMSEFKTTPEGEPAAKETKPVIAAIVDEIESRPPPVDGKSVAPNIEAADALTGPVPVDADVASETPVAKQNQANPTSDATANRLKRSAGGDMEIDNAASNKKLKSRAEGDEAETEHGMEDRQAHFPPPPGAPLDIETQHGEMRDGYVPPLQRPNRNKNSQQFEEPFKYIPNDHAEVKVIEKFYELSPRFPRDRFMVRNSAGEPAKTIYYTSALIRDILTHNEGKGIKFIHGGVRMFMKQDVQGEGVCKWRIQSEGMPILEGYVGEDRVVRLYKRETLRKLLKEMFPKIADYCWKNLGEIGERVNNIGMGCCVLRVEPSDDEDGFSERMVLPLWRSLHSLNLMLAKEDRSAMLLRLFNDTEPLINNSNTSKQGALARNKTPELFVPEKVAPGFSVEDDEIKIDTNMSIEAAAPVESNPSASATVMKSEPYCTIVGQTKEENEQVTGLGAAKSE